MLYKRIPNAACFAILVLSSQVGCRHCRNQTPPAPVGIPTRPPAGAIVGAPPGCNSCAPSQPNPAPPPNWGQSPLPQYNSGPSAGIQAPPAPTPVSPEIRRYGPTTVDPNWQPLSPQTGVRLNVPQPTETREPAQAAKPLPPGPSPIAPATAEERASSPALPVGIPQFATAREGVTTGLKPLLDGLDWLQANGYKAVLHLRQPGEDDSADRRLVEARHMKYISLEVSPISLAAAQDEFNRAVADPANRPLFVYDNNGTLAGAMWYLNYRTSDNLTDADARAKAARLGLREEGSSQSPLWLAIQKYLADRAQGR